jgi:hypothetical protein
MLFEIVQERALPAFFWLIYRGKRRDEQVINTRQLPAWLCGMELKAQSIKY